MISPVNTLLLLWLVITGLMIVMWIVGRRRSAAERKTTEKSDSSLARSDDDEAAEEVPHPALVGSASASDPATGTNLGVTTTETLDRVYLEGSTETVVLGISDDDIQDDLPDLQESQNTDPDPDPDNGDNGDNTDTDTNTGSDNADTDTTDNQEQPVSPTKTDTESPSTQGEPVDKLATPLSTDEARSLTDMLDGIKLPYDLTPVTSVVEDPDRHLIFLTTHSNAGEVGKRFADEMERLGFEFEPVEYDQAVATRGNDVVSMKIVPDANRVDPGDGPRYGAAGPGDVALELWIGRAPLPPAAPE